MACSAHLKPAALAAWLASALLLAGCQHAPEERLWVQSMVNGRPVTLFADTGSTISMIKRETANKLGLAVTEPTPRPNLPPGALNFALTAPGNLSVWDATTRVRFGVQDMPEYIHLEADGVVGWAEMRRKILLIDAVTRQILPLEKLPTDLAGWTRLNVAPSRQMLILEVPQAAGPPGLIFVDTGNPYGVGLSPEHWRAWRAAHADAQTTMRIYYTPGADVVTCGEAWARSITVGPLTLTDIPVEESDPVTGRMGGAQHVATLGMAALRRLDFILDGTQNAVFLRPRDTPPASFGHNRLGAVFTPVDSSSEAMVAHVAEGTPAYEAGLRDGDLVTSINNHRDLNWLKHPKTGLVDFDWDAGTKIEFQVFRNGGNYVRFARLRDLIGPGSESFTAAAGGH